MSLDFATFYFLFYQYDFVVGLWQGFMINAHEQGSNSPGAGTLSRDLTKTKSLQCRDFTWALHNEKLISPLFPGPCGDVVANDWCITREQKGSVPLFFATNMDLFLVLKIQAVKQSINKIHCISFSICLLLYTVLLDSYILSLPKYVCYSYCIYRKYLTTQCSCFITHQVIRQIWM